MDIWVAVDGENCERLSAALRDFGGFSADQVAPSRLAERGAIFVLGREPVRIDVINDPKGVEFEACWTRRNEVELDDGKVPLIHFGDLRVNKSATAIPQDIADINRLPPVWPVPARKPAKPKKRRR